MNAVDVVLLLLGSFFVIRGLFRGFSGEVISLVSVIGGFYGAMTYYSQLSDMLVEKLGITPLITNALAMFGIFFLVYAVCALVNFAFKKILKGVKLTWADKLFGGLTGLVKIYVFALLLLVVGMIVAPVTGDAWVSESKALVAAAKTWPFVYPLLDKAGMLPDLAAIQAEAKTYILRQAEEGLFRDEGTLFPSMPQDTPEETSRSTDAGERIGFEL